jgi:hypothetical protein
MYSKRRSLRRVVVLVLRLVSWLHTPQDSYCTLKPSSHSSQVSRAHRYMYPDMRGKIYAQIVPDISR